MVENYPEKVNKNIKPPIAGFLLVFILSLVTPSIGTVHRFTGNVCIVAYVIVVSIISVTAYKFGISKFLSSVTEKQAFRLMLLTFLGLIVVFAIVYPVLNSGVFGGGADRDDALNIAATELLHLRYPYYLKTYLGNPIGPLPGAVILATPFVILGNSAYQNFFWLFAFFITIKFYLKDGRLSLLLLWAVLGLSPEVLREFLTGGDGLTTSIYILIFILLLVNYVPKDHVSIWKKVMPAILLGIGLSSRSHNLLLLPPVFSMLVQNAGWRTAIKYIVLTITIFVAVTLPFYLYDPQGFSPLHQSTKLSQFHAVLPFAEVIIPLLIVIIASVLSFQRMDSKGKILLRNCAIVQALTVFSPVILFNISAGKLSYNYIDYGIYFLLFGTLYSLLSLVEEQKFS